MPSIDSKDGPIHYNLIDRRPPWRTEHDETIVFHHGLGACADAWWGWENALAEHYRLLRPDMRGHGRSPAPAGHRWSVESLADDLRTVADDAGLERFHLVGESIGGTAALLFAARHPERVVTLTVCNGAHRGAAVRNLAPWRRIIDDGGMPGWSAHMMEMRFRDGDVDEAAARWFEAQQTTCDAGCVLPIAAALSEVDLTPELARITMPTLLLHPDSSPFVPVALMAELHDALPDSRLRVFADAKHGLPFSHADACARELVRLLESVRRRRR